MGIGLYQSRRYGQAIEELRKAVDIDPSFVEAQVYLGLAYEQKGMFGDAIAELREAFSLSGGPPRFVSALGHAYAISGQRRLAEESLVRLKEQAKERYVAPIDIAVVYAGLKETDQTFKYLELAYEDRSYGLIWLRIDPRFRRHPRRSALP